MSAPIKAFLCFFLVLLYCLIFTDSYYSKTDPCNKYSGAVIYGHNNLGGIVDARIAYSINDILPLLCEGWNNYHITPSKIPIGYNTINLNLKTSGYQYDPQYRQRLEDDDEYEYEDYDDYDDDDLIPENKYHDQCSFFNGGIIKGTKYNISTQTCNIITTRVVHSNAEILPTLCELWNKNEIDTLLVTFNSK